MKVEDGGIVFKFVAGINLIKTSPLRLSTVCRPNIIGIRESIIRFEGIIGMKSKLEMLKKVKPHSKKGSTRCLQWKKSLS